MFRRAVLILPALLAACGWAGPEEQLLDAFFNASGLHDRTVLSTMATVTLNPRVNGTVRGFVVESMTPEAVRAISHPADDAVARTSLVSRGEVEIDLASLAIQIAGKEVTVNADLRTPDGRSGHRSLVMSLQRATATVGGEQREGRWVVTAFR